VPIREVSQTALANKGDEREWGRKRYTEYTKRSIQHGRGGVQSAKKKEERRSGEGAVQERWLEWTGWGEKRGWCGQSKRSPGGESSESVVRVVRVVRVW
jgi:hypothetical protein